MSTPAPAPGPWPALYPASMDGVAGLVAAPAIRPRIYDRDLTVIHLRLHPIA